MFYLTALFEKNFMNTYILKLGFWPNAGLPVSVLLPKYQYEIPFLYVNYLKTQGAHSSTCPLNFWKKKNFHDFNSTQNGGRSILTNRFTAITKKVGIHTDNFTMFFCYPVVNGTRFKIGLTVRILRSQLWSK